MIIASGSIASNKDKNYNLIEQMLQIKQLLLSAISNDQPGESCASFMKMFAAE
jgi:hypothetical protein